MATLAAQEVNPAQTVSRDPEDLDCPLNWLYSEEASSLVQLRVGFPGVFSRHTHPVTVA